MTHPSLRALCAALTIIAITLPVIAQEEGTPETDNAASRKLQESAAFVASLAEFTADVAMKFEISSNSGESHSTALSGQLALAGETRARFRVDTDDGAIELFYAPDSKYIYLAAENQYVEGASFGDRQQALTLIPGREYRPAQILLSDYLHNDSSLLQNAETVSLVAPGDETANAPAQVRVDGNGIVADFWIRHGDRPLLEKLTMDLTGMLATSNPQIASAVITYTLSDWNLDPAFPDGHFTFSRPEGAEAFKRPEPAASNGALEGKPAPAITLDLLDEGTLDLAEHRGKHIVILDFWASWCGPCRIGLPIVSEVAEAFADKGVVAYAVNIRESESKARAFVEDTGLSMPVAMDMEGVAQQKYGASSIPMTVIIDKDGSVHEVHRGVAPNMKAELTETLTEMTE